MKVEGKAYANTENAFRTGVGAGIQIAIEALKTLAEDICDPEGLEIVTTTVEEYEDIQ